MLTKRQLGWIILGLIFAIVAIVSGFCQSKLEEEVDVLAMLPRAPDFVHGQILVSDAATKKVVYVDGNRPPQFKVWGILVWPLNDYCGLGSSVAPYRTLKEAYNAITNQRIGSPRPTAIWVKEGRNE